MEYRKIGNSDLRLSEITFGAWAAGGWMWGGADFKAAVDAIRASFDLGVTTIDTAPVYGQGSSEEIVGEALKILPRDKVQILTKYGLSWDGTQGEFMFHSNKNDGTPIDIYRYAGKDHVIRECEDSLRRLKTDYIDLFQIHWPDPTTPISETMEAVSRLIEQGKVRYAGVCNYDVALVDEAKKSINLVSDQVPYSMVNRGIEKELLPYASENGLGIIAYSPMERGLLTGKFHPDHAFAAGDHRAGNAFFRNENIEKVNAFLEKLHPLSEAKHASMGQIVLRWTLSQPGISIVLAGARNAKQAIQNAGTGAVKLSADELSFISRELKKLKLDLL